MARTPSASASGSRSRSSSRSRSTAKKQTPSSKSHKKSPSKSSARTPKKTPSKSPARKASSASTASSSSSRGRGRPLKAGTPVSTPKQAVKRSASASSASRSRSRPAATPAALRVRTHAVTATPRSYSPRPAYARAANGAEGVAKKLCGTVCNATKEAWGGFSDGLTFITRRQLTRKDRQRRNSVWKVIAFLALAFFVYYTYMHKFVYYKQAYSYAQGYMDAARDFVNKKTK